MGNVERPRGIGWVVAVVGALVLAGCGRRPCPSPGMMIGEECLEPCTPGSDRFCHPDGAVLDVLDVQDAPRCEGPQVLCGARCVSTMDHPEHCGGCGQRCPGVLGGAPTCTEGVCGFECSAGRHACGSECREDHSPLSCGTSCTPCTAPANAHPTCAARQCAWECNAGYGRVGEGCEPLPPRPVAPLSTATVSSDRPLFRWALGDGTEGAAIEICRDRAFTVQCQTVQAEGAQGRAERALERGVWFWRLRRWSEGQVGALTSVVWQFTVGARNAAVDASSGSVLDVNGDGYADLAVGNRTSRSPQPGVFVYHGSAAGLSTTPTLALPTPEEGSYGFGESIASVGDVNGDGYADLAVGDYGALERAGRVYLYFGSARGLRATPSWTLTGPDGRNGYFGGRVARAGDLNGDGYADLAVAPSSSSRSAGRVYVYLGSARGLGATPAFTVGGPDEGLYDAVPAGGGDLNGDGYADLVVGSGLPGDGVGRVHVYFGSAEGVSLRPSLTLTGPSEGGVGFGGSLASAGDLNGDGYADLVVRAGDMWGLMAWVHVYLGSETGPGATPTLSLGGSDGEVPLGAVATDGDLNGDGYADLAVGFDRAMSDSLSVHVYLGSAAGLSPTPAVRLANPGGGEGGFGYALTSAGDLNGDGYADLVAGAFGTSSRTGQVHVYLGSDTGLSPTPTLTLPAPVDSGQYFGLVLARAGARSRAPMCRARPPA